MDCSLFLDSIMDDNDFILTNLSMDGDISFSEDVAGEGIIPENSAINGSNTLMSNYAGKNTSFHKSDPFRTIEKLLSTRVVVAIAAFGLLGNILNLIILTRKSLTKTMHRMEKSSHMGLIALSLSDMLFCIAVIPQVGTYRNRFAYRGWEFIMLYRMYSPGVINTFIMMSTWLTVTMAMQRYLAICHPIKARQVVGLSFSKWSVVVVFLFCVLTNIPRFFFDSIYVQHCKDGTVRRYIWIGPMKRNEDVMMMYLCLCFVFGLLLPICALTFCNVNLIRALQRSSRLRRMCSNEVYNKSRDFETTHRITLTLIVIVVMYTLLVTPAEVANFMKGIANTKHKVYHYNFATTVLNTAQSINFAFNFILYCFINTHFRKTLKHMLLCTFQPTYNGTRSDECTSYRLNSLSTKQTGLTEL